MLLRACSLVVILGLLLQVGHAQEDAKLEEAIRSISSTHHGNVAVYAKNLRSGQFITLNADSPVQTASVIKLAILYEALEQIRAGKLHFEDSLMLQHDDQVSGSGLLPMLDTPKALTFKDVLTLMIVVSDNTATNLAIDHIGLRNINNEIVSLGLKNTWLYKKVYKPAEGPMPTDQKRFGLGKTSAREMGSLMERFVQCDLNSPTLRTPPTPQDQRLCDTAIGMLKNQFYRESIPRYLETIDTSEEGSSIANKTGALDAVRNDVGVAYTSRGPILLSEFTWENRDHSWTVDNEAEVLMARIAHVIVTSWTGGERQK